VTCKKAPSGWEGLLEMVGLEEMAEGVTHLWGWRERISDCTII